MYEDAIYRTRPGAARFRCETLAEQGWRLETVDPRDPLRSLHPANALEELERMQRHPAAANAKWRAVHAYRSQLRAFADRHPHDLSEPERYKRLIPNPAAGRVRSIRR